MAKVNPISELQRKKQIEETKRRRKRLNEEARRIIGTNPGISLYTAKKKASYNIGNKSYTKRKYNRKPIIVCDCCGQLKKLSYIYKYILYLSLIHTSTPKFAINGLCYECHQEEKRLRRDPNFRAHLGQ